MREAAATSRYIYLNKPIVVLVSQVIVDSYVALRLQLKSYVLDTQYEKELEFVEAPSGMIGFETAYAVVMDLVRTGALTPLELIRRLSTSPARIIARPGGSLTLGSVADVVICDPEAQWHYDPAKGYSKSRNSPWADHDLQGRVCATFVGGRQVYDVDRGILT